jgi:4-hydroxy-tetrahydrodipicolinate synthase
MNRTRSAKEPPTELSGVICAALTPLDATLEPDASAAVAHCRRLLRLGCDGINLLGTTGEAASLSVGQRTSLMRAVAQSGLPLECFMVGTGASALADAVELTREAVALGYAGALVIPPFYYKNVSDDGVAAFYRALIERVADDRLRLYFYNFPQLSGVRISAAVIAEVEAAYPGVAAGIKDSSGEPGYADDLAARFALAVFPGSEAFLLDGRARGFAGCISATVNVSAPLAARVWRAADDARAAQGELTAIRAAIARYPMVPALRYLASVIGADAAWLRVLPPQAPLGPDDGRALLADLERCAGYAELAEAFAL